ncbi:MAG: hypothetical protein ACI8W7_005098, partial [Gammaproteobacteria bacterium]
MARTKSETRRLAGKLTSAVQKEWGVALGEDIAICTERVLHKSHDLLCDSPSQLKKVLAGDSVSEYLGEKWLVSHPDVKPRIAALE